MCELIVLGKEVRRNKNNHRNEGTQITENMEITLVLKKKF